LPFSGLNCPAGAAVDSADSVFVADFASNRMVESDLMSHAIHVRCL
jgi:hypothetical protein